ncbi:uncharacterized protein LOC133525110 isoform X1 [Cydia pomonella]|uniref:uncharacterized protein LOC133525110 isoform X1 n=1 Tax=Cydia pomonella TaxID=82600 RepID=UPI002ADD3632|nr:uncharacterized protein LOC133525110 isoform X1 [Cydia pomonella]
MDLPMGKEFVITDGSEALSKTTPTENMAPCNHEEADTRIMLHLADAVKGHSKVMLRTVDTDVVVLAISCVPKLEGLEELWVHIGTGRNHQYLACHTISSCLGNRLISTLINFMTRSIKFNTKLMVFFIVTGPERTHVLPLFHSFTGCDTTSSFNGRGKKTAFEAWKAYPNVTRGFEALYRGEYDRADPEIQKFVITMYDRSCPSETVNECRKNLFTKKDRQIDNLPPTEAALKQHTLRAVLQAVYVWGQCLIKNQNIPCPSEWGWQKEGEVWVPLWTQSPMAAQACLELIRCRCLKSCRNKCNCSKRQLKCTELCNCGGNCK